MLQAVIENRLGGRKMWKLFWILLASVVFNACSSREPDPIEELREEREREHEISTYVSEKREGYEEQFGELGFVGEPEA